MTDVPSAVNRDFGATGDQQLEHLLAESIAECIDRERSAFDFVSAPEPNSIVLFGAGRLGRRTLGALRTLGQTPHAFADNDRRLWGGTVDGVPVLSPSDAALRYGSIATFVVTIWRAGGSHRYEHSREQLRALGCRRVAPIALLAWKHSAEMLPHYCLDLPHNVLEEANQVRAGFALFRDNRSREEFVAQLRFRLAADFDGLPHPSAEPQYLAPDLFVSRDEEVFVDGGAFDGDTLRSMLTAGRPFARYIALEPDALNFTALQRYAHDLPDSIRSRVELLRVAAYSERTRMRIRDGGSASAVLAPALGEPREDDVECAALDELFASRPVSFIKLDIEGAEPDAIAGARGTIVRERPIIAMCVYHRQNHLWQLPLLVNSIVGDYRFVLRPYNEEGWDLVCYAIPNERALPGLSAN